MPRLARPVADGLLYHAINRGNNRAAVFLCPQDYLAFLKALAQTQERYPFRLFGYCLMTNHFHRLLSPEPGQSVSRIMQSLSVAHTWRYHRTQGSVGHVWQGRFKSPVIEDDDHALVVLRYIEANPLRAGMVTDLASYPWSSYRLHGMGRSDPLLSPLPAWETLAKDEASRQQHWRTRVHTPCTERELAAVRRSLLSGRPFGGAVWTEHIARLLGLPPGRASGAGQGKRKHELTPNSFNFFPCRREQCGLTSVVHVPRKAFTSEWIAPAPWARHGGVEPRIDGSRPACPRPPQHWRPPSVSCVPGPGPRTQQPRACRGDPRRSAHQLGVVPAGAAQRLRELDHAPQRTFLVKSAREGEHVPYPLIRPPRDDPKRQGTEDVAD